MADHRFRRSPDIRAVLTAGRRLHGRKVVLHVADRVDAGPARWTVVAGRKVGRAVSRNRAKRRLRAVLRETPLPPGADIVAVARPETAGGAFDELRDEVSRLMAAAATARNPG